jgi:hypothetical protein
MQQTTNESLDFSPVKTLKDFQREIDQLAFEKRIDFMDAVILYCCLLYTSDAADDIL